MTFLKVNYSSCFSPSVALGRLLRLFHSKSRKREALCCLLLPPYLKPCLVLSLSPHSPSLPASRLISLSNCFTLQRLKMGRSEKGTGYFHSNDARQLCPFATRGWPSYGGVQAHVFPKAGPPSSLSATERACHHRAPPLSSKDRTARRKKTLTGVW